MDQQVKKRSKTVSDLISKHETRCSLIKCYPGFISISLYCPTCLSSRVELGIVLVVLQGLVLYWSAVLQGDHCIGREWLAVLQGLVLYWLAVLQGGDPGLHAPSGWSRVP